ncbi:acyl-coenzyme A thioesterase 8 isoform X2 [Ictidomys tridecemlineatus]
MSSPQVPEDGQGSGDSGDPSGDLRSVLVTSVLSLEPLDEDLFRGRHYWVPTTQRLFGGQIVGQALVAAAKSVSEDIHVHSLHCYFVRAGDPKVPVLYQVERTRTGSSFSVRSVKAVQHGKPIFIFQASFQQTQPSPVQHQFSMPAVPPPEELLDHQALIDQYLRDPNLKEKYRVGLNRIAAQEVPIEIKLVNPPTLSQLQRMEPKQMFWVRARGYIGEGDIKMHCCVAAYISDYAFLGTALLPHQWKHKVHFMVSLDHSMWFHAPFRADHWMLYECESPWAGGHCTGHFLSCPSRLWLFIFKMAEWLSGASPRAAVASGWGPGCVLCPGRRHPSKAQSVREQAVARGISLPRSSRISLLPPFLRWGYVEGWTFCPSHLIKRLTPLEWLAFNFPGPKL